MLISSDTGGSVYQGPASALSADGNTAIVGGHELVSSEGRAWVFTRTNGIWAQQGPGLVTSKLAIGTEAIISVAISADGNTALVDTTIFTRDGSGAWTQTGTLAPRGPRQPPQPPGPVALSADPSTAIVGIPADNNGTGAALIFTAAGTGRFRGRVPR